MPDTRLCLRLPNVGAIIYVLTREPVVHCRVSAERVLAPALPVSCVTHPPVSVGRHFVHMLTGHHLPPPRRVSFSGAEQTCPQCADLICPANLALARHGHLSSREFFLLSDSAEGSKRTLIGLQHIRRVAEDFVFLEPDQSPPADGPYCRFMQHAEDRRFTDLICPGKVRLLDSEAFTLCSELWILMRSTPVT